MHFNLFSLCFLCFVIKINTLKVYIIDTNDDTQQKSLIEHLEKLSLINRPRDELRSEYEPHKRIYDKSLCDMHFGSIFGTKAQKLMCLENYYEDRNFQRDRTYIKRKRKQRKEPDRRPFVDLTRGLIAKAFSSDYLDLKDFARSMDADEFSKDYLDVGDLARDDEAVKDTRKSLPYETKTNKNTLNKSSNEGKFKAMDSDTESSSEEDSDQKSKSRFQVIDNKSSDSESEGSESSEEEKEERHDREETEGMEDRKDNIDYIYIQGRNRYVKDVDGRKRLQHFMPKRFHWHPDELKNLGYYWFDGPRGRFAEAVSAFKK